MNAVCIKPASPLYFSRQGGVMQDEILFGQMCRISAEKGEMCQVETFYRYCGFASTDAFLPMHKISPKWLNAKKSLVTAPFAVILKRPSVQSEIILNVPRGATLAMGERASNTYTVILPNGTKGFIAAGVTKSLPKSPAFNATALRERACKNALSYLGCQYLWGGKTPAGIDCSGLVSMAYLLENTIIYRDAKLMHGFNTVQIPQNAAERGDLLYFPGHVALALGKGRFIHSTAHNNEGVCIASLSGQDTLYREDLKKTIYASARVLG